jgi:RNA polymerase sigma-70 factor, ECF subfamily
VGRPRLSIVIGDDQVITVPATTPAGGIPPHEGQWFAAGDVIQKRHLSPQGPATLRGVAQAVDVTGLLQAWSGGDAEALEQLVPIVHRELRQIARRMLAGERFALGWQPTDLVHASYVRLLDWHAVHWQNRAHFFATTARMMRRVLVDAARARQAVKRGQEVENLSLEAAEVAASTPGVDVVALNDALAELATIDPRPSQVVELRFFGGFSVEETAETLDVSVRTVINDWNAARAWLHHALAKRGQR